MRSKIFVYIVLGFLAFSCKKRDFFNNDLMWEKLSKGNGIWLLEKKEIFEIKSDGSTELISSEEPNQTKYYFYTKLTLIFNESVENDYLEITEYNANNNSHNLTASYFLSRLAGGAENKRITLEDPAGNGALKVYTVVKGGAKNQIWEEVSISGGVTYREVIKLKKCNSCEPDLLGTSPTEISG